MIFRLLIQLIIVFSFSFSYASFPKVNEIKAENGLKIWYIQDSYLPIISFKIAFKTAGKAFDPKEKLGLANMVSFLLEEGTEKMSSIEYSKKLEELATSLYFDVDEEYFYITCKTLSYNLGEVINILNDILTKPSFNEKSIKEVKDKISVIIKNKSSKIEYIAGRKIIKSLVGDHPYSNVLEGTEKTIPNITRGDLVNFMKTRLVLSNATMSLVGDINKEKIIESANSIFRNVSRVSENPLTIPPLEMKEQGKVINIKFDSPQTMIVFGSYAPKIKDSDFFATYIANHILGSGGFESRFIQEIRKKRGLAYGIYSYLDSSYNTGFWIGSVSTENKKSKRAIKLIKEEIEKAKRDGFQYKEFKNAQNYIIQSFFLKMTKNANLASLLNFMQIQNLGMDFLANRNQYFSSTVIGEVNRSAYEWFDVKKTTFVVIGPGASK